MADSWLIDGNCENCRRKKYCKTECKLHRVHRKRDMYDTLMELTGANKILNAMSTPNFDAREHAEFVARCQGMIED